MNCDCKDWKESWHQIESAQVIASIHGQQYTGAKFKYCPWCNKDLKDNIWKPDDWKTNEPVMWKKTTTSDGIKVIMNGRTTSIIEDNALRSYLRGKYSDVPTSSDEFAKRKEK